MCIIVISMDQLDRHLCFRPRVRETGRGGVCIAASARSRQEQRGEQVPEVRVRGAGGPRVRRRAAGARQRRGARGGDDTLYFTLDTHGPGDSDSTHTGAPPPPPGGARLGSRSITVNAYGVRSLSLSACKQSHLRAHRPCVLIMYAERTNTRFYKFTCLLKP